MSDLSPPSGVFSGLSVIVGVLRRRFLPPAKDCAMRQKAADSKRRLL
ncbi:MAG: hypothetical protein ACR2P4_09760 [Gammaproteobacteria bacterium]